LRYSGVSGQRRSADRGVRLAALCFKHVEGFMCIFSIQDELSACHARAQGHVLFRTAGGQTYAPQRVAGGHGTSWHLLQEFLIDLC